MKTWTIEQSRTLYNIERWGAPYFDINTHGNVTICPDGSKTRQIDLFQISQEIKNTGLGLPVLLRVTDILKDRVKTLCDAFKLAKKEYDYHGNYHAVYPIKVNQQRTVVEHILEQTELGVGLEAGSKPELMIVLSHADKQNNLIICNGYKDKEYIRLALIGQKIGHQIFIVLEKMSELEIILEEAKKIGVTPQLGIRIRLASIGKGKWQNTGGEKSKFGLSASQILSIVQTLEKHDAKNCLKLIHCHLGSQLANIRDIQTGLNEIARYYAELHHLNIPIEYMDVGGGLGIDYEGSRSRNYCSMNYSVQEYANDIVQAFQQICMEKDLPQPNIITESGRAMTAHHAILLSNIIDVEPALGNEDIEVPEDDGPAVLTSLWKTYQNISKHSAVEAFHDATHWLSETQTLYSHGLLNLQHRANVEQLYFKICRKIRSLLSAKYRAHRDIIDKINEKLADKYFCNLSIFQSLPDIWAIDQVFPIMPIHRLNEEPYNRITLQDLTCDSDGKVENYVEEEDIETTLPAHKLMRNQEYIMGFFLVGAYQEILGDMHNLFGDTHSIDVEFDDDGNYQLVEAEPGDTIEEILSFIHYSSTDLLKNYQQKIDASDLTTEEKSTYLSDLQNSLKGYSYLGD